MKLAVEQKRKIESTIIEDLIDSDFDPNEDEAYAYIYDRYPNLHKGRLGSLFCDILNNDVNWNEIETEVKRIKEEIAVG